MKKTIVATLLFYCFIPLAAITTRAQVASSAQIATNASPKTAANRAETLFEYYIKKGLDAYIEKGKHNPKWNRAAEEALTLFARIASHPGGGRVQDKEECFQYLLDAREAGCTDPLVRYLMLVTLPGDEDPRADLKACTQMAKDLAKTDYSRSLKVFAELLPWERWGYYQRERPILVSGFEKEAGAAYGVAWKAATELIRDGQAPIEIVHEICQRMMKTLAGDTNLLQRFRETTRGELEKNWPDSAYVPLIRGSYYITLAWIARGSGYGNSVTPERHKLFQEKMTQAAESLEKAWAIDSSIEKIALEMLRVETAQAKGRPRMELWFRRAMALNTNSLEACQSKLMYLSPSWYGNAAEVVRLGREFLASTNWGGAVPYALITAHEDVAITLRPEDQAAYWKKPAVWADVKAACEKCLQTHPDGSNSSRHSFIYWAQRCGKSDELLKQAGLLYYTNLAYFGGSKALKKMMQEAESSASKGR